MTREIYNLGTYSIEFESGNQDELDEQVKAIFIEVSQDIKNIHNTINTSQNPVLKQIANHLDDLALYVDERMRMLQTCIVVRKSQEKVLSYLDNETSIVDDRMAKNDVKSAITLYENLKRLVGHPKREFTNIKFKVSSDEVNNFLKETHSNLRAMQKYVNESFLQRGLAYKRMLAQGKANKAVKSPTVIQRFFTLFATDTTGVDIETGKKWAVKVLPPTPRTPKTEAPSPISKNNLEVPSSYRKRR